MIIRADLHVHSAASVDGLSAPEALAAGAAERGLQAIAISDHNRCTRLPSCPGVLLIPGVELSTDSGHLLGLFLERPVAERFLTGFPPLRDCAAEIRRCGGVAVLAHPFAPQKLPEEALSRLEVDAIEGVNARAALHPGANEQAQALARRMGLPVTGGSDAHCLPELGDAWTEMEAEDCTPEALRRALLAGRCRGVLYRPCPWRCKGRSRLQKARRVGGLRKRLSARLYLAACLAREFLHI